MSRAQRWRHVAVLMALVGCSPRADESSLSAGGSAGEASTTAGDGAVEDGPGSDGVSPASSSDADGSGSGGPSSPEVPADANGDRGECGLRGGPVVEVEDALPCEDQTLPGTGGDYCIKANPDCLDEGASCPLYVFDNFDGDRLFERVEQPERYGPIIVVRAKSSGRDFYAELPRVIAQTHPGLDQQRIYAMGFSVGSAHLYEALTTGDFDSSPYGTTSDLYAAVANLGGCMKISDDYETIPNFHLIMINGAEDPFGNNGCDMPEAGKDWARKWAVANDCDDPQADWAPVEADDPLMAGGDGTDKAVKLAFGACEAGDIVAYRFRDEEHELSFDLNFDDKVHAVEIAWDFLSGRRKEGGLRGVGSACRP